MCLVRVARAYERRVNALNSCRWMKLCNHFVYVRRHAHSHIFGVQGYSEAMFGTFTNQLQRFIQMTVFRAVTLPRSYPVLYTEILQPGSCQRILKKMPCPQQGAPVIMFWQWCVCHDDALSFRASASPAASAWFYSITGSCLVSSRVRTVRWWDFRSLWSSVSRCNTHAITKTWSLMSQVAYGMRSLNPPFWFVPWWLR